MEITYLTTFFILYKMYIKIYPLCHSQIYSDLKNILLPLDVKLNSMFLYNSL
jgi:hypothetical protein